MSDSFLPFSRGYTRRFVMTFSAVAVVGMLSAGCQRRVPEAAVSESAEARAKAALEKALAEDKARER